MGSLQSAFIQILVTLNLTIPALAAPTESPIDMICVTEMPTTSFMVTQEKEILNVVVFHHNGARYAPFSSSLITAQDVDTLKDQARMIEKLGDRFEFQWKRSGCNADSRLFFQCVGEARDFEVNGIKVHPWALTVNEITEKNIWGTYQKRNVNLSFSVDSKNYQITMDYQPGDCVGSSVDRKFQEKLKLVKSK